MVFLITLLAFVLGGVSFYFRTNARMLEAVDAKMQKIAEQFLPREEGKRLEEKIASNTRTEEHILRTLDEIKRALAELSSEVRVVQYEMRNVPGEER